MTILPEEAESALGRPPAGTGDTAAELAALQTLAAHNMRLLKAQIVPLIDAALRVSTGVAPDVGIADRRDRWTRTALRLIDDTAIAARSGATGGAVVPVDFGALLHRAAGAHHNRIGPVTLGSLPKLLGRPGHLGLLAEEVMAGIARIAARELRNGLLVGQTPESDGATMFWFQDLGSPVPPRSTFTAMEDGDRAWSVCRNLMARSGGGFHLSKAGRGRLCLALRFPAEMVLAEA